MNLDSLNTKLMSLLRGLRYGERVRPQRDWLMVAGISFVLLVASAGWSYWLFMSLSSGTEAAAAGAAQSAVNTASLDAVRMVFDARAAEKAHYLSDYHFVDPSR